MWGYREFSDRREAGRRLAAALGHLAGARPLVLALPRGGVPVGFEVAEALGADLDILIVRKIGAPGNEEFGIGAIVEGAEPQLILNERAAAMTGATESYVQAEKHRQLREIERRRLAYRGDSPAPDVVGRTVIVVDDGIATGGTMKAALRGVRRGGPARLVLAVPVAAPDSLASLARECDEVVCLSQPSQLYAIGAHYADFSQLDDEEVRRLLAAAHEASRRRGMHPPEG